VLQFDDIKPEPVIIKKVVVEGGGGHHGGAWKVAYADFVTAMMAFFLLMWIIGATTEDQRKGIADYFRPTLANQSRGGGANGVLQGRSLTARDGIAMVDAAQVASLRNPMGAIDRNNGSRTNTDGSHAEDDKLFDKVERMIREEVARDTRFAGLADQIEFVETAEGLRIEIIDKADFAMFEIGTSRLSDRSRPLIGVVAAAVRPVPHRIAIRGHTDSRRYDRSPGMNNWLLSAQRADSTRRILAEAGIAPARLARIEGVADRELHVPADPLDPRNRRISITLLYR
jgi:chemotaxis protein MotB